MERTTSPLGKGARLGVTDRVTELFHDEIRSGRWAVGTKIPVERDLVAWTGAGRNSIREAVQALSQAGLLQRQQGRGTFVLARSQLERTLTKRVEELPDGRREGLELRMAIDEAAASLASERRTEADVEILGARLAARASAWAGSDRGARIDADIELHRAVVAATHNSLLSELYDGLIDLFRSVLERDVEGEHDPHAELHEQLVRAIVAGDPTTAGLQISRLLDPLIADEWRR